MRKCAKWGRNSATHLPVIVISLLQFASDFSGLMLCNPARCSSNPFSCNKNHPSDLLHLFFKTLHTQAMVQRKFSIKRCSARLLSSPQVHGCCSYSSKTCDFLRMIAQSIHQCHAMPQCHAMLTNWSCVQRTCGSREKRTPLILSEATAFVPNSSNPGLTVDPTK